MPTRARTASHLPRLTAVLALALFGCSREPPAVDPQAPVASAAAPVAAESDSKLRFSIDALDRTANPCVDFYDYACGGWRKTHPIPADRSRWSRYAELEAENLERERAIVEEAARETAAGNRSSTQGAKRRVGDFYSACMDEPGIEARGLGPVAEIFGRIDAMRTTADVVAVAADLHVHHVSVLFDAYVAPDRADARRMMLGLGKGSLGLPAPRDYTSPDGAPLRERYRDYLAGLFKALGAREVDARAEADRILALETSLAKRALSPAQARDPESRRHPMTAAELATRYAAVPWATYFEKLGVSARAIQTVNVATPAWLEAVDEALKTPDLPALRAYFRARVLQRFAIVLPSAIRDSTASFEIKVRGAKEVPPRWKRCLSLSDQMIGDDVGRLYLERHFTPAARERATAMTRDLRKALSADIESLDWLSPEAKKAASAKLARLLVVVGASNRMHDYQGLVIRADDPFGDVWRARAYDSTQDLAQLGAPTDRERFFEAHPQDLDAFGSHAFVASGFTAGFLQPPVFDDRLDDAVSFGGLGAVMGHELSHQFDDEGHKFDVEGNLKAWWSPEDVARFAERAQCFVDEYSRFHAEEGTPLDGKLTLGENIADNGGLRLAYSALHPSESGPPIDGFTPAQRFFLAWGQIRCENVSPDAERRQVQTDGHSPGRARVDGVVSNMPEFARAFSCAEGSPMAPAKRCRLW